CKDEGLNVKSHMSSIDDEVVNRFKAELSAPEAKPEPEKPKKVVAPPPPAPPKPKPVEIKRVPVEEKKREAPRVVTRTPQEPQQPTGPTTMSPHTRQPIAGSEQQAQQGVRTSGMDPALYTTGQRRRRPQRPRHQRRSRTRVLRPTGPEKGQSFEVELPVTVRSLSTQLGIKQNDIIGFLLREKGLMTSINDALSEEVILEIAEKFEIEIKTTEPEKLEDQVIAEVTQEDKEEDLILRAPVVAFLGHVDHGKTSLLDRIRKADVAAGESGGITQHIGAYTVDHGDSKIAFLDTPGHEAFSAMRARGANVTDIVVLVIAADDGVMPQTQEAVDHAREAGVAIVVALNKIDLPHAKPDQALQQLAGLDLLPEEWGGDTIVVRTSAITGEGVNDLFEMLLLQAEILELKANPDKGANGTVIEALRSEGRGIEVTVLIQDGTLERGDYLIAGNTYARVRAIFDDKDRPLEKAGPSTPVKVIGFSEVPDASSQVFAVKDLQTARDISEQRELDRKEKSQVKREHVTLETLSEHLSAAGSSKEIRFIVKADVQGSLEVLTKAIQDFSTEEVKTRIIRSAVGGINESDIILADASDALVIGFHVVADDRARSLADEKGISVDTYQVIYRFREDIRAALEGMLDPEEKESIVATAEVRQLFSVSRIGTIAGCIMRQGTMLRNNRVRLIRDGIIVFDGRMQSLRHLKDDVREIREGFECGIKLEGFDDVKTGDMIQGYEIEKIARKLESAR
ncbi:MAG: translation initiation factor IF-2, partial [Planctomycetota bacterium]|nr:translation initiation factor IF-2 [Planctomycetota bacterium]